MSTEHEDNPVASEAAHATVVSGATKKNRSRARKMAGKQPHDPFASNYGEVPFKKVLAGTCTEAGDLGEAAAGRSVVFYGTVLAIRPVSRMMAVVVLRHYPRTVRCVVAAGAFEGITTRMVRFATTLARRTIVIVHGVVSLPQCPTNSSTQQVEIQVKKLHSVSFSDLSYPIKLEDAAQNNEGSREAVQECLVCRIRD
ncbi:unnamed protein product [Urochloa decumbens]|uniref:Uncharacterized protein n=1 Tax=Urochloa decumbens TaxID=240449 RepID=A0ABC8Y6A9_9POAL